MSRRNRSFKRLMSVLLVSGMLLTENGMPVLAESTGNEVIQQNYMAAQVDTSVSLEVTGFGTLVDEDIMVNSTTDGDSETIIKAADVVGESVEAANSVAEPVADDRIVRVSGEDVSGHIDNGTEQGINWRYDLEGNLTISGTGDLVSPAPWQEYRSEIKTITVELSGTKNASSMFSNYSNLQSLYLEDFDTSSVTDMSFMFSGCNNLIDADVGKFDTSNVMDMFAMFEGCSSLKTVNVSKFDTSIVTDMSCMFYGCSSLTSVDTINFSTSNVMHMESMFSGCSSLTRVDVSSFDTSNVISIWAMFDGCSNLENLDVHNFNTSNVTGISYMFCGCSKLTNLNLSNFDTKKITSCENINAIFAGCTKLESLDISGFNLQNIVYSEGDNIWYMCLSNCKSLREIKAPINLPDKFVERLPIASGSAIWYRTDTNENVINLPTRLAKSVTLVRNLEIPTIVTETNTLVVKQKLDITDRFTATTPYKKYTTTPKGAAAVTSKGILTAKKPVETVVVTGLVKDGKVWKEAESVTFKIEKPVITQKTITATKPETTFDGNDNITGTTLKPTSWISSKPTVAEINTQTGVITTKSKGTAKITAVYGEGKNAAKYTFSVKVNIPVMSKTKATALTGAALTLRLKNVPKDRTSEIRWESSDDTAAKVDSAGKVTIFTYNEKTGGKVTITATIDDVPYSCEIEVKKPEIKKSSLVIKQGKSGRVALKNTKLKDIKWVSADERIVTVDEKGKVTGVAPGTAIIRTTAGGVTSACEVTVK